MRRHFSCFEHGRITREWSDDTGRLVITCSPDSTHWRWHTQLMWQSLLEGYPGKIQGDLKNAGWRYNGAVAHARGNADSLEKAFLAAERAWWRLKLKLTAKLPARPACLPG